jgi:hypothetical protein
VEANDDGTDPGDNRRRCGDPCSTREANLLQVGSNPVAFDRFRCGLIAATKPFAGQLGCIVQIATRSKGILNGRFTVPLKPSRALPWFESYTDQDWITKMRCDTTVNEEPTLTADMIGFTESVG